MINTKEKNIIIVIKCTIYLLPVWILWGGSAKIIGNKGKSSKWLNYIYFSNLGIIRKQWILLKSS